MEYYCTTDLYFITKAKAFTKHQVYQALEWNENAILFISDTGDQTYVTSDDHPEVPSGEDGWLKYFKPLDSINIDELVEVDELVEA